ncbi:MAG: hypothetical protein ACTS4W_00280 [Candidatus Hodgkinia cicadicola]
MIWVALNRATKRTVTTYLRATHSDSLLRKNYRWVIDLITAEVLFDWSISEKCYIRDVWISLTSFSIAV